MSKIIRNDVTLKKIYADNDLSEWELFKGNYINFGYWKDIDLKQLSVENRAAASKQLYELLNSKLVLTKNDTCLEVGCGKGIGSISMAYSGSTIVAVDLFEEQVARAQKLHLREIEEKNLRLSFTQGSSSALPFENENFNKLYSVEAAQHFPSLIDFTKEAFRVLKPKGHLALTTYFLLDNSLLPQVSNLIPWIGCEFELGHSIHDIKTALREANFTNISCESIGQYVWEGMDAWMIQTEHKGELERNYLKAYKTKLLDYFLISAEKP